MRIVVHTRWPVLRAAAAMSWRLPLAVLREVALAIENVFAAIHSELLRVTATHERVVEARDRERRTQRRLIQRAVRDIERL